MDLLGAYGSDSDGDDPRPVPPPVAPPKRGLLSALPPPKARSLWSLVSTQPRADTRLLPAHPE
jgi:hypothetical protein